MSLRGAIVGGVAVVVLMAAGGVVASSLTDLPQDAVPVQDSTAALNRQTPSQTPPVEPAPESAPAPATPIAVTPPTPTVVIAAAPGAAGNEPEEAVVEAPLAKPDATPAEPARRQRRRVAIVEAIDKITAESMRFEVEVGGRPVRFQKTLIFTARACEVSAPDELVSDAIAYLEVSLQPRGVIQVSEPRQIFRGWMFASSPAVSGLQHPVYDAWVVGCKA
ncbi:MAG: DUF2155 domain-containing protein [Brevundimonas sp.]|uniref:DUF2155 domain-containing protein n=1 Tax=Brevundimonas sp. TaxID=1871086 RepID=UPI002722C262|nr:DUF2155 domain-containing protein [Brevundimonas sp.]MDO9586780.1 DUF2155 domain-containing protein [Brevundimonas sp.]MDP3370719.1 DUF2155 domain-containing protein [Brevundimonas sp.]MDP3657247.1 DUF2155 domain-containing protein [Brevundimonas sp.]MDZ4112365.1 DUF2155 domain-containing protein [Brevundimonas sp.]